MSEEKADTCEVCKDKAFVFRFCNAMGGDAECKKLTERAGRGEISGEEYFAIVQKMYGQAKVDEGMRKALEVDPIQTTTSEEQKPHEPVVNVAPTTTEQVREAPPPPPDAYLKNHVAQKPVMPQSREEKREVEAMNKQLENEPKFKSSLKGLCVPCMGEPTVALLKIVKKWFVESERGKIDAEIIAIQNGTKTVEDGLKEVLKMKGGYVSFSKLLGDLNTMIDLATNLAVDEKPDLGKEVQEENK